MFEFGRVSMILDKVTPLECWKNIRIFSVSTHTFVEMYVAIYLARNMQYVFTKG
jgi:hypothetical protein